MMMQLLLTFLCVLLLAVAVKQRSIYKAIKPCVFSSAPLRRCSVLKLQCYTAENDVVQRSTSASKCNTTMPTSHEQALRVQVSRCDPSVYA